MSPNVANFLFEVANFGVLAGVLAWVWFKPVRAALDRERARRDAEARDAAAQGAEAERKLQEATKIRNEAEREGEARAQALVLAAQREAERLAEEARGVRGQAQAQLAQQLATQRQQAAQQLVDDVAQVATASVEALLRAVDGPSLHLSLVRTACQELAQLPAPDRQSTVVESAQTLDASALAPLRQILGDQFTQRQRPELLAGIRILMNAGQIDASAVGIARQAGHKVASALRHNDAIEVPDDS